MNVLSLFDGMSCGQIALERAGIPVSNYFASEIDKHAIKIAKKNYPKTKHIGSVTDVYSKDLYNIDLLVGGSPCQGFSFSGKQLNFADPRSSLFFEFVRVMGEVKPKYFLLENVRMKKEHEQVITDYLGVSPISINSSLVSAQNRNRLYWTNIPNVTMPEDRGIVIGDIAEDVVEDRVYDKEYIRSKVKQLLGKSKYSTCFNFRWDVQNRILVTRPDGLKIQRIGRISFKDNKSEIVTTVTQPTFAFRKASEVECERLQTVPDNYTQGVSKSQRYKMLGNGWTVDIVAHIFKGLKDD